MASNDDESLVLVEGEAVGHAGQIVGHGAVDAVALGQSGKLDRQPFRVRDKHVEHLAQRLLSLAAFGEDARMAVDLVEEKSLQSAFFSASSAEGRMMRAAWRTSATLRMFCRASSRLSDSQHVAHLPVDHLVDDRAAKLAVVEFAELPRDAVTGLAPQRHFEQLLDGHQAKLERIVGIVGVVGDAVGRVDDLDFK